MMETDSESTDSKSEDPLTPTEKALKDAILKQDVSALREILEGGCCSVNFIDTDDNLEEVTPLMYAASTGTVTAIFQDCRS